MVVVKFLEENYNGIVIGVIYVPPKIPFPFPSKTLAKRRYWVQILEVVLFLEKEIKFRVMAIKDQFIAFPTC